MHDGEERCIEREKERFVSKFWSWRRMHTHCGESERGVIYYHVCRLVVWVFA